MHNERSLLSVGIDVGTTTTQIVLSRLTLADLSGPGQVPRLAISAREVLYHSPVAFTPLSDHHTVDAARLADLVRRAYAAAEIEARQIETGAVIITGETAKKSNASQILTMLAGFAGDFVVSVAGPHVEGLIAGRGAGAADYARRHFTTVVNVDIGGGSANSAVFTAHAFVTAAAMNIGGRILELDAKSGQVCHVSEPARAILADCRLRLEVGDRPGMVELRRFADRMADLAAELVEGTASPLAQQLYLTAPLSVSDRNHATMFSGGVGQYCYEPTPVDTIAEVAVHGDIGPLLAQAICRHRRLQAHRIVRPQETLHATVLGAATQTVTLSGSTIWVDPAILPLRNVPVVRPHLPDNPMPSEIAARIDEAVTQWDIDRSLDRFALALETARALNYDMLVRLAMGLCEFASTLPPERPLVIVLELDYARALGQAIKGITPHRPLLVVDHVRLFEGDYIDLGVPFADGRVVPLSVKTLAFYR